MGEVLAEDLFDQDKLEGAKTDVDGDDVALKHLCSEIYARISSFLQEDFPPDDRLRQVQTQTHKSLGIIRQALETYSYVIRPPAFSFQKFRSQVWPSRGLEMIPTKPIAAC